jgi:hypothetical protein
MLEDSKYHIDHHESKTIADVFYRDPHFEPSYKSKIKRHCIQITGLKGQVVDVQLVDDGF